jgi:hypothetical protein
MTKTTIVCDWCGAEDKPCEELHTLYAHVCQACAERSDIAKVVVLAREAWKRIQPPDWARQQQGMTNAQLHAAGKWR